MTDVKARIQEAMDYAGEDWLERACDWLSGMAASRKSRRVVYVSTPAERIKWARECAGMTQNELALRLKLSRETMGMIERGKKDLELSKVRAICIILKIAPDWLTMASDEGGPVGPKVILRKEKKLSRFRTWKMRQAAFTAANEKARILNSTRPPREKKT